MSLAARSAMTKFLPLCGPYSQKLGLPRGWARLCSVVPSNRRWGNEQKLRHKSSTWTWGRTSLLFTTSTLILYFFTALEQTAQRSCGVSLPHWRYSRTIWTQSCAVCFGWPCLSRRLDQIDPSSLTHSGIMWGKMQKVKPGCGAVGKAEKTIILRNILWRGEFGCSRWDDKFFFPLCV